MTMNFTPLWRSIGCLILVVASILLDQTLTFAQSPSRFTSGDYASPNNWSQGSSVGMTSAFSSFVHTTTANGTGNRYFRFYSATSGGTTYEPNGSSDILLSTNTPTALQVTGSGKAYFLNVGSATDNYVFKTIGSGSPGTSRLIIFRVQGAVRAVSNGTDVTRSPSGTVYPGQNVVVSAVANGVLATGQRMYLRYTTNSFSTSTIIPMAFVSGTTYSATIPASDNQAGATLNYYVLTSGGNTDGSALSISHSDADLFTINGQTNSGSNYSYTVANSWVSAAATAWGLGTTWAGGVIPTEGYPVTINHGVTLDLATRSVSALTIADGVSLALGNNSLIIASTTSGTTLTGGGVTGSTITSSATGRLITSGIGTQTFAGRLNLPNTRIGTAVNFGTNSTIVTTRSLTLISGGSVSINAPTYAAGSTLEYAQTGTVSRGTEWSATSGVGYPANVLLTSTNLNMGTGITDIRCSENLNIPSGTTLSMQTTSGALVVGSLTLGGTLVQSTNSSSSLRCETNVQIAAGSTYTHNSRTLSMFGATNGTISGLGTTPLFGLEVNKTGGSKVTITDPRSLASSGSLTLTNGILEASTNLSIGSAGTVTRGLGSLTGTVTFAGNNPVTYTSAFSGTTGPELPADPQLADININSGAVVSLGRSIDLNSARTMFVNGTLNLVTNTITGAGTMSLGATAIVNITNSGGISAVMLPDAFATTEGAIINLLSSGSYGASGLSLSRVTLVIKSPAVVTAVGLATFGGLSVESGANFSQSAGTFTISRSTPTTSFNIVGTFSSLGTVAFTGSATHTLVGGVTFQNLTLAQPANVPTGVTVNGTLTILANGAILSNALTYGPTANLTYNTGGSYTRNLEWSATTGPGYPKDVTIASGTTLNLLGSSSANRQISGDLVISGSLNLGSMSNKLLVLGNSTLSGSLILGSAAGGDLELKQQLIVNAGAFYNANGREILFSGTVAQSISGSFVGTLGLPLVGYSGTSTLTFSLPVSVSSRFRLSCPTGTINPAGNLTISTGATVFRQAGTFVTPPAFGGAVIISYGNSQNLTTDNELPTSPAQIGAIYVDASAYTTTLNRNLVINGGNSFNLNNGIFALGTNTITGAGAINLNGGILRIGNVGGIATSLATTTRNFNTGIIDFNGGGAQNVGVVPGLSNMRLATIGAGTAVTLDAATNIRGFYVGPGTSFDLGGRTLTITISSTDTTLYSLGSFVHSSGKVVFAGSSSAVHIIKGTIGLFDVDIIPAGLCGINFGNGSTINGTLSMYTGSYCVTSGPTYAVGSTLNYRSGGTYNITVEWSNPYNVRASFATLVNIGGSLPTVTRTMRGDLTIDFNSAVSMNESGSRMTAPFSVDGDIVLNGGLYLSNQLGGDLNVGGNFYVNTGFAFFGNSRAVTFNGAGNQMLAGTSSSPIYFQFLTINKPSGDFRIDHSYILDNGSGTARFWQIAGTTYLNNQPINLSGSGTKTFRVDAGTLYTDGTDLNVSTLTFQNGVPTSGRLGGTIVYNKTGTENLVGVVYNNLTLAGSSTKTMVGNLSVDGLLDMTGGATLNKAGFTLAFGGTGALRYAGNLSQTVGDEWPATSGPLNVEINNPAFVSLAAPRTIAGTLTMRSGDLNLGGNLLTIGTSAISTGNVVLPSNSTGAIVGLLRRWISNAATTYQFPIGLTATRRNAEVVFSSAPSAGGTLTAQFIPGRPTETGFPLDQGGITVGNLGTNGIWEIEAGDGLVGGTYGITLTGTSFLGVNNVNRLVLVKRASAGAPWTLLGTHIPTTGVASEPIAARTGLTSFSQFGIGGNYNENPLPVTLTYFGGNRAGSADYLSWITTEELDNEGFILSSSDDGLQYQEVLFVPAANRGKDQVRYSETVELNDAASKRYYRLQQRDHNGMISGTWFAVIQPRSSEVGQVAIWPNPVTANTKIILPFRSNEPCQLELLDATGRILHNVSNSLPAQASDQIVDFVRTLPGGTYWLRTSNQATVLPVVKVSSY